MAARTSHVYMRNFPVLPVKLSEGVLTRRDVTSPDGGRIDDVVYRAAEMVKGALVELDGASTNKDDIVVKAAVVDGEGRAHGKLVSDPFGQDDTTVSGQIPVHAFKRVADVAFFGLGVIEMTVSADATIKPGASVAVADAGANQIKMKEDESASTLASNGGLLALGYHAAGEIMPVLVCAFQACAE